MRRATSCSLRQIEFVEEPATPSADEMGTDAGIEGVLRNIHLAHSEAERTMIFDVMMLSEASDRSIDRSHQRPITIDHPRSSSIKCDSERSIDHRSTIIDRV